MAEPKPDIAALVEQFPEPDKPGQASKFTGPDPEAARKLCEEVLAGGHASLVELIGLARPAGEPDFTNYKAEYLLHCLAVHVGGPDLQAQRKLFVQTLAREATSAQRSKAVRALLIRELQWAGGPEAIEALGSLLLDEDLCDPAAAALAALGGDEAVAAFRKALPKATGRVRLVALQNLGVLRDAKSAGAFRQALGDPVREVRLAGAWGLARMGDAPSAGPLLKLADDATAHERIKATQACLLLAEGLSASGKKAEAIRIYAHLRDTRTDPKEQYIRDAASKALDAMGAV